MSAVFLSYSRVDVAEAGRIKEVLDSLGIPSYQDTLELELGDDFDQRIRSALSMCAAVVVIISPATFKSEWVPYEIGQATALNKIVISYLTHSSIELPIYLTRHHCTNSINQLHDYFQNHRETFRRSAAVASSVLGQFLSTVAERPPELLEGVWDGEG